MTQPKRPPDARPTGHEPKAGGDRMPGAWLEKRSLAFQEATSKPPGKAAVYGAQKKSKT